MYTEKLTVTPDMAAEALENDKPVHRNRPFSETTAMNYALDMKEDRWDEHHQGYAFGPDGEILDGQHRLWAQFEAGISIEVLCTFNMPVDRQKSIDDHKKRSVRDVASILFQDGRVENLHAAISNRMRFGSTHMQTRGISKQQTLGYLQAHFEPIDFAVQATGGKPLSGITRAAVLAPVARAWFTQNRDRLVEFVKILMTGQTENVRKDYIAIQLRDYLTRSLTKKTRPTNELVYSKVERALLAFLKGEQMLKLYEAQTELFPIPSDDSKRPIAAANIHKGRAVRRIFDQNRKVREQAQAQVEG